ncbi:MAG: carboxypeptidase regulatory-like domain-containing protein, partial [Gemmatimonadaceae bacterium]
PFLMRDTTDASGGFRFCGLPNSLRATLKARHGSVATAEIPIALGDRDVELGAKTILLPAAPAPAKRGNAEVSGVVTLEGAKSYAGIKVELLGTDLAVTTDDQGHFTLRNAPSGTGVLLARHVGFMGQTTGVDLTSREPAQVAMSLPRLVEMMDPVLILARKTMQLDKVGFVARRKLGIGHFIGPEQLEKWPPGYFSEILATVPGIRVRPGIHGGVISSARSGASTCMQYFHDDQPYEELSPGDINRFIITRELVAIEVYQAEETPAAFVGPRGDCTTIVIWTKRKIHS